MMNTTTCITQPMEVSQQPVLHIEARVKADGIVVRTDVVLSQNFLSQPLYNLHKKKISHTADQR